MHFSFPHPIHIPSTTQFPNIIFTFSSRYSMSLPLTGRIVNQKKQSMQRSDTILSLTMDLLANNAFNHLRDDEISALHHLILKLTEPLSPIQQGLLLTFWNHAYTGNLPASLLHRCNTVLLQLGRSPMEIQE